MKWIWSSFLVIILFSSCKSNSQSDRFENFKKELSQESINKVVQKTPFPFSNSVVSSYKYFNYYETFGNSGICVQFNLTRELEKEIINKFKDYKTLQNSLLIYKDSFTISRSLKFKA